MAIIIMLVVLIATVAVFYLKCSMMQSLATFWSSVLAMLITFSFYELAAGLIISRGYGIPWAQAGCFLIVFVISFAVLRTLSDMLIRVKIDLGASVTTTTKLICGLLTGFILAGSVLTVFGLVPLQGKLFYSRFDPEAAVAVNRPTIPALNADGFVTGLYGLASSGSLSTGNSFGVLHADYLTQIHLNKLKVKDSILPVCSHAALTLPTGKELKPLRLWDIPDVGQVVVVRAGIAAKPIEDGGANHPTGAFNFYPAQLRLITKADAATPALAGFGKALYPKGFLRNGKWLEIPLGEVFPQDPEQMKNKVYWMDIAFEVPSGQIPVLLQFRNNAVADLTSYKPVKTSPEIEAALDSNGQDEAAP